MKHILVIIAMALFCLGLSAVVTVRFDSTVLNLNKLNTFTFDPVNPQDQPILTNLTITNLGAPQKVKLQMELKWNSKALVKPGEAVFVTAHPLATNGTIRLSNRDLVNEHGGTDLVPADGGTININLIDIIENFPTLESAVLSGYFPDGELLLEVSVKGESSVSWEDTGSFRIRIRNAGAIYPLSPGKAIGQVPPIVKDIPVSFLWNAINTGFNKQQIVIKEFPPNNPPSYSSVAQPGVEIYNSANHPGEEYVTSGFADYIPFSNNNYYAWQVSTPITDQTNIPVPGRASAKDNSLTSEWFVFRYMADDLDAMSPDEVQALLNVLGNINLTNILNMGFTPTGEVFLDGRQYTGQDAVDILSSLAGKDIQVQLKD
ncbi:MAG: hypothetical protein PHG34_08995 [Candidatus Cloacimonetes bacterium]|nr:hypothetical protein [Candidatus Cloacimonadota bacterium]